MPISDDEWESGREWTDTERAVAEFLDAVAPRAYAVAELHQLFVDGGTVTVPESDESGLDVVRDEDAEQEFDSDTSRVDVAPMDVTERELRAAANGLRDAEYLDSKAIRTADGFVTHYRRCDCGMF
ncbi:hypothetical protein [Halobellus clavatus]|jgi:hypothetical protein|uniref:Uncharacterized protein n=1 Tax=Halobellus clavatus TaxID=660517 RepID=A0A1H3F2G7_9EURY|nr:hypothetical protein [Halobellus clavatus]SDX85037.1 hypothetical protein SAMN04487946_10395 [Halobellus clavatus]